MIPRDLMSLKMLGRSVWYYRGIHKLHMHENWDFLLPCGIAYTYGYSSPTHVMAYLMKV
jgi:hypothetical protein